MLILRSTGTLNLGYNEASHTHTVTLVDKACLGGVFRAGSRKTRWHVGRLAGCCAGWCYVACYAACLLGCSFDGARCLVCELCRLKIIWVVCVT